MESSLCSPYAQWVWGHPLEPGLLTRNYTHGKIDSPSSRSPQLSKAPFGGLELVIFSQLLVAIMAATILCWILVCSRICCEIRSVTFCPVPKMLLTLFLHDLWLLQHFCPLFCDSRWALGSGKCDLIVWFVSEHFRHVFPPLWVLSFFVKHCYTKKLFWWGLGTSLVYGYRDTNLEGSCYYSHLAK